MEGGFETATSYSFYTLNCKGVTKKGDDDHYTLRNVQAAVDMLGHVNDGTNRQGIVTLTEFSVDATTANKGAIDTALSTAGYGLIHTSTVSSVLKSAMLGNVSVNVIAPGSTAHQRFGIGVLVPKRNFDRLKEQHGLFIADEGCANILLANEEHMCLSGRGRFLIVPLSPTEVVIGMYSAQFESLGTTHHKQYHTMLNVSE